MIARLGGSGGVGGRVGKAGGGEGAAALGALVAGAAVTAVAGLQAAEAEAEGQSGVAADELCLVEAAVGGDDRYVVVEGVAEEAGVVGEEGGRGVGEGVLVEGADGDLVDLVRTAPDGGQADEEDVAAWQEDGAVGRIGGGDVLAGGAPVVAVEGSDGQGEADEELEIGAVEGGEVGLEGALLGVLPRRGRRRRRWVRLRR